MKDWADRVTTYTYYDDGRLKETLRQNNTKQLRQYDAAGRLEHLKEYAPNGTTILYAGDYRYDVANQLVGETINPAVVPVFFTHSQSFDADNRLLTHNGETVTIDPDGNLTGIEAGVSPASYGYDIRNRLTSAGTLTYTYDAENRRVAQTDASGTTSYVINPNAALDQVLMKTVGGITTFYVYGLGLLHEETGGAVRYYHFDRRGDTVALTDGSGTVTGRAAYGVFGELSSTSGTLDTPFLFNGRWGVQTDTNGLYYHRARYYHPGLRRFLNQDVMFGSITNGASMNRFAYANGNPVTMIDPFGLMAQDEDPNNAVRVTPWILRDLPWGLTNLETEKAIFQGIGLMLKDVGNAIELKGGFGFGVDIKGKLGPLEAGAGARVTTVGGWTTLGGDYGGYQAANIGASVKAGSFQIGLKADGTAKFGTQDGQTFYRDSSDNVFIWKAGQAGGQSNDRTTVGGSVKAIFIEVGVKINLGKVYQGIVNPGGGG